MNTLVTFYKRMKRFLVSMSMDGAGKIWYTVKGIPFIVKKQKEGRRQTMKVDKKHLFTKVLWYIVMALLPFLYFPFIFLGSALGVLLNITFQVESSTMEGLLGGALFAFLGIALLWTLIHYIKRENKRPFIMSFVEMGGNIVIYPLAALILGKLQDELFWILYILLIAWPLLELLLKYPLKRFLVPKVQIWVSKMREKAENLHKFDFMLSLIWGVLLLVIIILYYVCWRCDNMWVTFAGIMLCGYLLASVYVHIRAASPHRFLTGVIGLMGGLVFALLCIYRVPVPLDEFGAVEWIAAVVFFWQIVGFVLFELVISLVELACKQAHLVVPSENDERKTKKS